MPRSLLRLPVSLFLVSLLQPSGIAQSTSPIPKHPVTDEYHGVRVVDDYRWLEDWDNPEVKQWSAAENARTREYLDHLPTRPSIKARLARLLVESSSRYFGMTDRGGRIDNLLLASRVVCRPQRNQHGLLLRRLRLDGKQCAKNVPTRRFVPREQIDVPGSLQTAVRAIADNGLIVGDTTFDNVTSPCCVLKNGSTVDNLQN